MDASCAGKLAVPALLCTKSLPPPAQAPARSKRWQLYLCTRRLLKGGFSISNTTGKDQGSCSLSKGSQCSDTHTVLYSISSPAELQNCMYMRGTRVHVWHALKY